MYQKEILELTKALNPNYYFVTLFFKYKYIIIGGVDWKRAGGGGGVALNLSSCLKILNFQYKIPVSPV